MELKEEINKKGQKKQTPTPTLTPSEKLIKANVYKKTNKEKQRRSQRIRVACDVHLLPD
jgi:hypothetical protein